MKKPFFSLRGKTPVNKFVERGNRLRACEMKIASHDDMVADMEACINRQHVHSLWNWVVIAWLVEAVIFIILKIKVGAP